MRLEGVEFFLQLNQPLGSEVNILKKNPPIEKEAYIHKLIKNRKQNEMNLI